MVEAFGLGYRNLKGLSFFPYSVYSYILIEAICRARDKLLIMLFNLQNAPSVIGIVVGSVYTVVNKT